MAFANGVPRMGLKEACIECRARFLDFICTRGGLMFINAHSGAVAAKRQLTIIVMIQGSSVEDSLSHCKAELPPIPGSLPHPLCYNTNQLHASLIPGRRTLADLGRPGQTSADPGRPWHSRKVLEGAGQVTSLDVQPQLNILSAFRCHTYVFDTAEENLTPTQRCF